MTEYKVMENNSTVGHREKTRRAEKNEMETRQQKNMSKLMKILV